MKGLGFLYILIAILFLPFLAYMIWAEAYVLTILWSWFIVPKFFLPALTWLEAAGIALTVRLFRPTFNLGR